MIKEDLLLRSFGVYEYVVLVSMSFSNGEGQMKVIEVTENGI